MMPLRNKNEYIKYLRTLNFLILKYFKLLVALLFIVTMLIGYYFLLKPRFKKITDNLEATESVKHSQKDSYDIYLNKLKRFNKSFDNITKEDKLKINTIIPNGNDYGKVIELIAYIVEEQTNRPPSNITVTIKEPVRNVNKNSKVLLIGDKKEAATIPSQVKIIESSISIEKISYEEFKNFLSKLENSLRIIDITNVSYSLTGGASFVINFYFYDE